MTTVTNSGVENEWFVYNVYVLLLRLSNCTLEPNLCDEKRTTQCDEYTVCCPLGNDQYGCCPFTEGTCCPGTSSCCPPGFSCTKTGSCRRTTTIVQPALDSQTTALRDRQREAAISGRSVRSVIETEVEPETTQCPRLSCVQMTPKLKTHSGVNTAEVYERLNQNDNLVQKMEKEKPPSAEIIAPPKPPPEKILGSKESTTDEYPDERDKLSAEGVNKDGQNSSNP